MRQKIVFMLLAGMLFIGAGCSTTNEQTTVSADTDGYDSWELYTHEEYGFSFEHPSDWSVIERGNSANLYTPATQLELNEDPVTPGNVILTSVDAFTVSIEELYSGNEAYELIEKTDSKTTVRYEEFNAFSSSVNVIYLIQGASPKDSVRVVFSKGSMEESTILNIITTIST